MKISINNGDNAVHTGHGHVTLKLLSNLAKTKHSVLVDRPAQVEMTFSHPKYYKFYNEDSYKIGYTAWESTEIPQDWHEGLSKIDELWVPNNFTKNVMSKYFKKDIFVFGHGVDNTFSPAKREVGDVIKFLHMGHPAYRKGMDLALEAFLELYKDNPKYQLTIKTYGKCPIPEVDAKNVKFINDTVPYSEVVDILHNHHILLYPSWGEGFGLIPLQALATGMPVIMTMGWADYEHYVYETLIPSKLTYSPWQIVHPGKMYKPNYEQLKNLMIYSARNIEGLLEEHYEKAFEIHEKYSWEKVVSEHFDAVEARLVV
jgi:glycosyltransferase involved in cell wall biosynthesis